MATYRTDEAAYPFAKMEGGILATIYAEFPAGEEPQSVDEWYQSKLIKASVIMASATKIIVKTSPNKTLWLLQDGAYATAEEQDIEFAGAFKAGRLKKKAVILSNSEGVKSAISSRMYELRKSINLTKTTCQQSTRKAYLETVDKAYIKMLNGTGYEVAVREATRELASKGITGQTYTSSSGRLTNTRAQDAVRRQFMTSASQLNGEITTERSLDWGNNLVEVDSHGGARPEHAVWQGRVYALVGTERGYRNLAEVTGYGTVTGLKGTNCYHDFRAFIPGWSERLYKPIPREENNAMYADKMGRRYRESAVRSEKEQVVACRVRGDIDGEKESMARLKEKQTNLRDFKADRNLTGADRIWVYGYNS